jgi:hypothetical protein
MSLLLLLISSLQQNWKIGQNRFCLEARGWEGEGGGKRGSRGIGEEMAKNLCTYEFKNDYTTKSNLHVQCNSHQNLNDTHHRD